MGFVLVGDIAEDAGETVAADVGVDVEDAELGEMRGEFFGGVFLLAGEFGVRVEVFVKVFVGGEVYGG